MKKTILSVERIMVGIVLFIVFRFFLRYAIYESLLVNILSLAAAIVGAVTIKFPGPKKQEEVVEKVEKLGVEIKAEKSTTLATVCGCIIIYYFLILVFMHFLAAGMIASIIGALGLYLFRNKILYFITILSIVFNIFYMSAGILMAYGMHTEDTISYLTETVFLVILPLIGVFFLMTPKIKARLN